MFGGKTIAQQGCPRRSAFQASSQRVRLVFVKAWTVARAEACNRDDLAFAVLSQLESRGAGL